MYQMNPPTVYVIGSDGLRNELLEKGIRVSSQERISNMLLVGYDVEFNYQTIVNGFKVLLKDSIFIACNLETRFPSEEHKWMPGCACMVAAIEAASGKKPDYIIGKPNTFMLELIAREHNLKPAEILVVGDTPESDIFMANKFGSPSALFIPRNEFEESSPCLSYGCSPTIFIKDHRDLMTLLKEN